MKIRTGQRAHVSIALAPLGKVVLGEHHVNARSESDTIEVGTEVVVERATSNELIVRRTNQTEKSELGTFVPVPIDHVKVETQAESSKRILLENRIHLSFYVILPGIVTMVIAFMQYQTPFSAFVGFLIGATMFPFCLLMSWVVTAFEG